MEDSTEACFAEMLQLAQEEVDRKTVEFDSLPRFLDRALADWNEALSPLVSIFLPVPGVTSLVIAYTPDEEELLAYGLDRMLKLNVDAGEPEDYPYEFPKWLRRSIDRGIVTEAVGCQMYVRHQRIRHDTPSERITEIYNHGPYKLKQENCPGGSQYSVYIVTIAGRNYFLEITAYASPLSMNKLHVALVKELARDRQIGVEGLQYNLEYTLSKHHGGPIFTSELLKLAADFGVHLSS